MLLHRLNYCNCHTAQHCSEQIKWIHLNIRTSEWPHIVLLRQHIAKVSQSNIPDYTNSPTFFFVPFPWFFPRLWEFPSTIPGFQKSQASGNHEHALLCDWKTNLCRRLQQKTPTVATTLHLKKLDSEILRQLLSDRNRFTLLFSRL